MNDTIENEKDAVHYNQLWDSKYLYSYRKEHIYVAVILALIKQNYPNPQCVLDVGAGFGFPALRFISNLNLKRYTVYEFSNAFNFLHQLLKPINDSCMITLHNSTFKDMNPSGFDCVIALEILEHITWDISF